MTSPRPSVSAVRGVEGQAWLNRRERGTVFTLKLIAWLARTLGRRTARLLLYPVCAYYLIVARAAARASREYLDPVLGRRAGWRDVFRHFHCFAATLLDRVFLFSGRHDIFRVTRHGEATIRGILQRGHGCLLLSAHLGSFEHARLYALNAHRLSVNMMMYEENARKIRTVIESLGARRHMKIIPIGNVDTLLRAKECLERGELVGILGDRAVASDRLVRAPFLGREAAFPAGPFLAASILKVPVVLFFCLYRGGNHYEEYYELLAESVELDRRKPADLEKWVRRYAERLEHYCRLAPYNWFNFYDFWSEPLPVAAPPSVHAARRASREPQPQ